MKGMIKTLSKKRGYGFIKNENGEDVFFSSLQFGKHKLSQSA